MRFEFSVDRRTFVQVLGAGMLITVAVPAFAQRRGRRGGGRGGPPPSVAARFHFGEDGKVTVFTGKTEMGQGARGEIAQAAAEELRVPLSRIRVVLADTGLVPNDGLTAGSRTTPSTVPVGPPRRRRRAQLLVGHAAKQWNVEPESINVRDGAVIHAAIEPPYEVRRPGPGRGVAGGIRGNRARRKPPSRPPPIGK